VAVWSLVLVIIGGASLVLALLVATVRDVQAQLRLSGGSLTSRDGDITHNEPSLQQQRD
jgi:hypothetical protein